MKKKIKNFIRKKALRFALKINEPGDVKKSVLNTEEIEALGLVKYGFLRDLGWWNSWSTQTIIAEDNSPLPWVTYSFIYFIKDKLNNDMTLFEYGSGNSTLYYSKLVKVVYSVEHDKEWFDSIKNDVESNVNIEFKVLDNTSGYEESVHLSRKSFDIIIVDGRRRVKCVSQGIKALNENGILVLDDAEREQYKDALKELTRNNFKELQFWGIAPGINYMKCTSIFYRKENVLDI